MEINEYLKKFEKPFEIEADNIAIREMAENYNESGHKIIPLEDIHQAIKLVIKPVVSEMIDPYKDSKIEVASNTLASHTGFVKWNQLYLWPLFQRDVSPNHIRKIWKDFDPSAVITPCAIKLTIGGKEFYFVWDGHHTLQTCRFNGYETFKIDYIDIDQIPDEKIQKDGMDPKDKIGYAIWLAGTNMIRINARNKKALHQYDEFMIKVETKDPDAIRMNNILKKNDFVPVKKDNKKAKTLPQIKMAEKCYYLDKDDNNLGGQYLDRALKFHSDLAPKSPAILEMFQAPAHILKMLEEEGQEIPDSFWDELIKIIKAKYGDPQTCQLKIKASCDNVLDGNTEAKGHGNKPKTHLAMVISGLINLYNQNGGEIKTIVAPYRWQV